MANHIQNPQSKIDELTEQEAIRLERINEFRAYLLSDKFNPIQQDGSRGDIVAVSDVLNYLRRIQFTDL